MCIHTTQLEGGECAHIPHSWEGVSVHTYHRAGTGEVSVHTYTTELGWGSECAYIPHSWEGEMSVHSWD